MLSIFGKSKLMTSDVVLSSKGTYGVVLKGTPKGDLIKWFKNNHDEIIHKYRSLDMLDESLNFRYDGKDNRIIKVFRVTDQHDMTTMNAINDKYLIWEERRSLKLKNAVKNVLNIVSDLDKALVLLSDISEE